MPSQITSSGSGTSNVVPWGALIAIKVSFWQSKDKGFGKHPKKKYCDAKNIDEETYLEAGQILYILLSNKKQPMKVEID